MPKHATFDLFHRITVDMLIELYKKEALNGKVIDAIHKLNGWFYVMSAKIKALETSENIDKTTHLLKPSSKYFADIAQNIFKGRIILGNTEMYQMAFIRLSIDDYAALMRSHGERVVVALVRWLSYFIKKIARPMDYNIYVGDGNFNLILPHADKKTTASFVKKVHAFVQRHECCADEDARYSDFMKLADTKISASVGVIMYNLPVNEMEKGNSYNFDNLYHITNNQAYKAMLKARSQGKNCMHFD